MTDTLEVQKPKMKIIAIRPAEKPVPPSTPGMSILASRPGFPPEDFPRIRQERFEAIRAALLANSRDMNPGSTISLDLQPQVQRGPDTCMLACAISVAKAVALREGKLRIIDENMIAKEARQLSLLIPGGMDTLGNPMTFEYLQEKLGLTLRPQPLDARDGEVMAKSIAQSIQKGDVAFVNSAAHWVVVFGINIQPNEQVVWIGMDPLRDTIQRYTTEELSNRLLGSSMSRPGVTGVRGEVLIFATSQHS